MEHHHRAACPPDSRDSGPRGGEHYPGHWDMDRGRDKTNLVVRLQFCIVHLTSSNSIRDLSLPGAPRGAACFDFDFERLLHAPLLQ